MLSVPILTKVIRTCPSIQLDCGNGRLPMSNFEGSNRRAAKFLAALRQANVES